MIGSQGHEMRLKKISRLTNGVIGGIVVEFVANGITGKISLPIPENFDTMTRAEKIAWGKSEIASYMASYNLSEPGQVFFPDSSAQENAAADFENLPGWATWTATEAESWIETNVTNLATAKTALKAMAKAIVYLRNVTIEQ